MRLTMLLVMTSKTQIMISTKETNLKGLKPMGPTIMTKYGGHAIEVNKAKYNMALLYIRPGN